MSWAGRIHWIAVAVALFGPAAPLRADCLPCPDPHIVVENGGGSTARVCEAASLAVEQLSSCGLVLPERITIEVVGELPPACLGIYNRGELRIEIRTPEDFAEHRQDHSSLFSVISDDAFYESTIRHELVHAALEDMPCPFPSCLVSQEYVAYAMQIRFLPEADRAAFEEARSLEEPVSRDMLNAMILFMAPDTFARFAWGHLSERPDQCAFIRSIARGEVLLDFERP